MTADDIAKARQAIAEEATGPTFISTRRGERYLAAAKDPASGWAAALDDVERMTKVNRETHEQNERMCREVERVDVEVARLRTELADAVRELAAVREPERASAVTG